MVWNLGQQLRGHKPHGPTSATIFASIYCALFYLGPQVETEDEVPFTPNKTFVVEWVRLAGSITYVASEVV
jgi:hypothetical protein